MSYVLSNNSDLFEVTQGQTESAFDSQYTALAIRSESVVTAPVDGYVSFFVGDAAPIYVGQQAYMIDSSGELSSKLKSASMTQAILNENDLNELAVSLNEFKTSFDESEYYETYQFRYQIESQIIEQINSNVLADNNVYFSGSYSVYNSDLAGIAVHYTDGFESVTTDSFEASSFKKSSYSKNIIRSNDFVSAGSPVYKVITSEDWSLVIQVSDPDTFEDLDYVTLEFLKDNISIDAEVELITRGGNYYAIISLDKYMVRYASDRYLQITFTDDTASGLMIPKTAVTEQSYFVVPKEYLTLGGNSNSEGFLIKTVMPNGTVSGQFRAVDIVRETDELCYVAVDNGAVSSGDVLIREDSDNTFTVGMTDTIEGVYAYSSTDRKVSFRFVDILGSNGNYYIVDENTDNGLIMYDQIYADYREAAENAD